MKSIKSDGDKQKRSSVFQEKINRGDTVELAETAMTKKGRHAVFFRKTGVTPSVAAPGDIHPSDATEASVTMQQTKPRNIPICS